MVRPRADLAKKYEVAVRTTWSHCTVGARTLMPLVDFSPGSETNLTGTSPATWSLMHLPQPRWCDRRQDCGIEGAWAQCSAAAPGGYDSVRVPLRAAATTSNAPSRRPVACSDARHALVRLRTPSRRASRNRSTSKSTAGPGSPVSP